MHLIICKKNKCSPMIDAFLSETHVSS